MTMRTTALTLTIALALACQADSGTDSEPMLVAPPIYRVSSECGDCRQLTLYRDGAAVELRSHHVVGGAFVGRSSATLTDSSNAELDGFLDALAGEDSPGEFPQNVPHDSPVVTLWLPDLEISYALNYPPSGVVELDELLWALLDDLSECRTN